ncbi:MAG: hypothetical protein AVDCRST_MAG66-2328 [uncultured Pseudonocardia sp.]|uniref:SPOR domain-containing protein n=1 Tax=uncultured Pseudonocardia sp. TaxID=211455 RepID=A0A6J4PQ06_9PSEU|nr:MAG: hypothetical protein AVDCRST_MAG66-2328 [uncultured Pseudonocardia sp.]
MTDEDEWYYSLKDGKVVRADEVRAVDRLGPYPDRETAARALEIARERTEAADRADRRWRGDDDGDDD